MTQPCSYYVKDAKCSDSVRKEAELHSLVTDSGSEDHARMKLLEAICRKIC